MQLQQYFIRTAKKHSKKVAIIDQVLNKKITYKQLLIITFIMSKKLAHIKSKHVGVLVPTSAASVFSILSCLFTGKIPVMINYATGAEGNCKMAQEKCHFKAIITSKKFLDKKNIDFVEGMIFMEDIIASMTKLDKLVGFIKSKLPRYFAHIGKMDDPAVTLFTTGSEKAPKGVILTHKNLTSDIAASIKALHFTPDDSFIAMLPLFHVFGITATCLLPLTYGCTIITHANPLEYQSIVDSIRKHKATTLVGTPTFLKGYLAKSKPGDFDSLRVIVAGADKLPTELRRGYKDKHDKDVLEGYGTTETSPVVSVNRLDNNKPGSIGLPLPGVQVKIVGIDSNKDLPNNCEGKILIKGPIVMKGYLDEPELTAEKIVNGWYDTGDIGIIDDDGFIWHRGRYKRFIKVGGEMVSLVAVEDQLQKILPEGVECCAVERPHPIKGSQVVVAITAKIDNFEINQKLSKNLPPIAIPKEYIYFEELPIMGSGKINFREVQKMCDA